MISSADFFFAGDLMSASTDAMDELFSWNKQANRQAGTSHTASRLAGCLFRKNTKTALGSPVCRREASYWDSNFLSFVNFSLVPWLDCAQMSENTFDSIRCCRRGERMLMGAIVHIEDEFGKATSDIHANRARVH